MRTRPILGALALAGLVIGFLVALVVGTAPGGHLAIAIEWTIQVLVLAGAVFLLAHRITRRS